MDRDKVAALYTKYDLSESDVFKHKHYLIITRSGIDKIQGIENIDITYDVIESKPDFCVVKAKANTRIEDEGQRFIETFGSAKFGKQGDGNTTTWYVMEMAEKRAMSRAVLKLTGFYELGVFGEDESEDFKKS
jgi:hypothetical protein|tara:strand:- start:560 stop:958 length:399 start_codon:yes stop_codon:yes gene_type:complete